MTDWYFSMITFVSLMFKSMIQPFHIHELDGGALTGQHMLYVGIWWKELFPFTTKRNLYSHNYFTSHFWNQ